MVTSTRDLSTDHRCASLNRCCTSKVVTKQHWAGLRRGQDMKALVVAAAAIGMVALSGCAATNTTSSESQPAALAPPAETTSTATTPAPAPSEKSAPAEPAPPAESTPAEPAPAPSPPSPEGEHEAQPEGGKPRGGEDEPGSPSHEGDESFCTTHTCIGKFKEEPGTVVQCADGTFSHAGGISGACSHHEGER
jgi:type IV secretory pathway VirB10-like protein